MPKKVLVGKVLSDKMDKTVTVEVKSRFKHPVYNKIGEKTKKYHAHDENNVCKVGDVVEIMESKPISKTKKWVVNKIVEENIFKSNETPETVEQILGGEEK
ncbi:MAG TPA: 30S ribosomal protein S17 [Petrotogaceae bacterium]|nr:30S ribosomal protein S17 [Petrotogaceae bacterium]